LEKTGLLIVDDDEDTLETVKDCFHEKGYSIETAKTGRDACTKAKNRSFDVALIDIKLPDTTGIEVLREFRQKYPSMANIIITANATVQNAVDALNLGANSYVTKPIDFKRLEQTIEKYYEQQKEFLKNNQVRSLCLMRRRTSWMRRERLYKRKSFMISVKKPKKSGRRSKLDIQLEILDLLVNAGPLKLTHMMYKVNVNCSFLKTQMGFLINRNLIKAITEGNNRFIYTITNEGRRVNKHYREVEDALYDFKKPAQKMNTRLTVT
jgi:DNA-binding response OmpR family regulator